MLNKKTQKNGMLLTEDQSKVDFYTNVLFIYVISFSVILSTTL